VAQLRAAREEANVVAADERREAEEAQQLELRRAAMVAWEKYGDEVPDGVLTAEELSAHEELIEMLHEIRPKTEEELPEHRRALELEPTQADEEALRQEAIETGFDPSDLIEVAETPPPSRAEQLETAARKAKDQYGNSLPEVSLSAEWYNTYERFYGRPLSIVAEEDPIEPEYQADVVPEKNTLLREAEDGVLEEVEYRVEQESHDNDDFAEPTSESESQDAIAALHKQVKQQNAIREQDSSHEDKLEVPEEEDVETQSDRDELVDNLLDEWPGDEHIRTHPLTVAGRYGTKPSTVHLPGSTFVEPVSQLIAHLNTKHLTDVAQRSFGGVGLPYSASTPRISKTMQQKPIGLTATQNRMTDMEADVFMTVVMPQVYASVMGVLVEVRKRLGSAWLKEMLTKEGGPLVLDAGAGGAGVVAWREILKAEWENMHAPSENEEPTEKHPKTTIPPAPAGRATVLTGSDTLRHRASRVLENTTFLPRLPDMVIPNQQTGPQPRKQYDIIIASHMLWPIKETYNRSAMVQTLWSLLNPDGGILIILEKGVPRGFEVVAGARDNLLRKHIASADSTHYETPIDSPINESEKRERFTLKETGCIIAPCTNHLGCPLYKTSGISQGRKDWCYFGQRYIRPPFLQSILGAKARNHDDVEISYVAVQRGRDQRSPEGDSLFGKGFVQGEVATERAFQGYGAKRRDGEEEDVDEEFDKDGEVVEQGGYSTAGASSSEPPSFEEQQAQDEDPEHPPHPLSLPRTILTPLKRKGHVLIDVCTPSGTLERWMVSRNRPGKQAFRDARKAQWGDLWALGAKSRTERRVRLGKSIQEAKLKGKGKGKWKEKGGKGGKGKSPEVRREVVEEDD
jgi:ribosomal protein RSM22 (predicted rRNA methylase)